MNAEEVRERLELLPFDQCVAAAIVRGSTRQSGRTTRMICEALAAASKGSQVLLVFHSLEMAAYTQQICNGYAERLGLDVNLLHCSSDRKALRGVWHRVFTDHVVQGQL